MSYRKLFNFIHFIEFLHLEKNFLYKEFEKQKELKNLVQNEQMETFFQPIVSLNEGFTIGFETLNRPIQSKQFPTTDDFYDYVGKSKDVLWVEQYIRNRSIKKFSEQVQVFKQHKDRLLFLNIQPQVLMDPQFQSGLTIELLEKNQLSPYQIVLELTEKEASTNIADLERLIDYYRIKGFRIAVDDAGSGYNSLKTLVSVKPEFIKLDKSLIRNSHKRQDQQNLIELLVEYASQSDTHIIAEGIESFSECQYLQKVGVDYGQGYALGIPEKTLFDGKLPLVENHYRKRLG